jgi:CHASE2 domain-containing sensor protein
VAARRLPPDEPEFEAAVDSISDVLSGKIPAAKYENKIVLIGATAAGLGAAQVAPASPSTAPVLTMAHTTSSILGEHFLVVPNWGVWSETLPCHRARQGKARHRFRVSLHGRL